MSHKHAGLILLCPKIFVCGKLPCVCVFSYSHRRSGGAFIADVPAGNLQRSGITTRIDIHAYLVLVYSS